MWLVALLVNPFRATLRQVLAIFGRSKVQWPPSIIMMYRYLSALNFNLEITGAWRGSVYWSRLRDVAVVVPVVVVCAVQLRLVDLLERLHLSAALGRLILLLARVNTCFTCSFTPPAPECSIPSLKYDIKWMAIELMPVLGGVAMALTFVAVFLYRRCAAGRGGAHPPPPSHTHLFRAPPMSVPRCTAAPRRCAPVLPGYVCPRPPVLAATAGSCWASEAAPGRAATARALWGCS